MTWRETTRTMVRAGSITALAFSPGGQEVAVGTDDPDQVLVLPTSDPARVVRAVPLPAIPSVIVWPDGSRFAVAGASCPGPGVLCPAGATIQVVSAATGQLRTATTGAGTLALTAVPGSDRILAAASGAGLVDEVSLGPGGPRITRTFRVGSGDLAALAANAKGSLAAVSNATAGRVSVLDLNTGAVAAVARVSYVAGSLAFLPGVAYLAVGEPRGENVAVVHITDGSVPTAVRVANFPGPIAVSGALSAVVAGSLQNQGLSIARYLPPTSAGGRPGIGWKGATWLPLGPPATGTVLAVAVADGGLEALALAPHGLCVVDLRQDRVSQRLLPRALGGAPALLAVAAGSSRAAVVAGRRLTILRGER